MGTSLERVEQQPIRRGITSFTEGNNNLDEEKHLPIWRGITRFT
jgi:hypothetical protein